MNRRSITKTLPALALGLSMAFGGCQSKPQTFSGKVEQLKTQVESDAKALKTIEEEDYPALKKEFRFCDSILQYMDSTEIALNFEKLNLTHAYLSQFEEVGPDMRKKMDYSMVQLDKLKTDAESHYISDSLASAYLETEALVADTLHHRVLYFKDRFAQCHKDLSSVKKNRQ